MDIASPGFKTLVASPVYTVGLEYPIYLSCTLTGLISPLEPC
jgi:hypothetical protein